MKLSERRAEIRGQLDNRVQESIDRKSFGSGIFKTDVTFKRWNDKSSEEAHVVDVLPYVVGENPTNSKVRPGDIAYSAEYWVHNGIGPNEDKVLCLARNFNKPCAICEDRKVMADEYGYDDDRVKKLKPTRQVLYNVIVRDTTDEEKKGVQVWMVAHWFFERFVDDLAKASRGRGRVIFADPKEGKQIQFYRKGKESVTYSGHQFVDRTSPIPDELVDSTYCLEDLVYIPSEEEIKSLYFGKTKTEDSKDTNTKEESKKEESKKESSGSKCPGGGTFAIDIDNLDGCSKCEQYDACCVEAEKKGTKTSSPIQSEQTTPSPSEAPPEQPVQSRRRK